jgi:hypothetical protein
MVKRALILSVLALALTQVGCSVEEGVGPYKFTPLTSEVREELERDKRELLKIEDVKVGTGPLAAWNRRIEADIEARYTDGTIAYQGSIWINIGFESDVFLYNATYSTEALDYGQPGIWLGLNGMAVGGKRRFTIEPKLVSGGVFTKGTQIRRDKLVVEAVLTDSCVPILLRAINLPTSRYLLEREVWCRSHNEPKRSTGDPVWRFY